MGGDKSDSPKGTKKRRQKDVDEWLQIIIDDLASVYHWSKEDILKLYPKEVEILSARAVERRNMQRREMLFDLATAACVPNTKDGGKKFFENLMNDGQSEEVTKETIERDNKMAKRLLNG